jgi:hypothetical protein
MRIVIDLGHDDLRVRDLASRRLREQLSRLRVRTAPAPRAVNAPGDAALDTALDAPAGPAGDTARDTAEGTAVAKSDGMRSLAELAVTGGLSAASVGAVARVLVAFVQRAEGRRLTVRHGTREVSITGPVPDDLMAAVEALVRQAAENPGADTAPGGPAAGPASPADPATGPAGPTDPGGPNPTADPGPLS